MLLRCLYGLAKFKKGILYNPLEGIGDYLAKGESQSMKHVAIQQLPGNEFINSKFLIQTDCNRLELLIHMFPRPGNATAKWEQFDFDEAVWIRP